MYMLLLYYSAFHCACELGYVDMLKILLDNSKDFSMDELVEVSQTCLHPFLICAKNGFVECASLLLDRKVDINLRDYNSRTALHFACLYNHIGFCKFLLDKGADSSLADCLGSTPLHYTVLYGYTDCCRTILDKSTESKDATNILGCTALHIALQTKNCEIVKLLNEIGASFSIKNEIGKTPGDILRENPNLLGFEIVPDSEENTLPVEQIGEVFRDQFNAIQKTIAQQKRLSIIEEEYISHLKHRIDELRKVHAEMQNRQEGLNLRIRALILYANKLREGK